MASVGDEANEERFSFSSVEMDDGKEASDSELPPRLTPNPDIEPEINNPSSLQCAPLDISVKKSNKTIVNLQPSDFKMAAPSTSSSSMQNTRVDHTVGSSSAHHTNTNANIIDTHQRIRKYNDESKAPFTVWIKSRSGDLLHPLKLSKFINGKYKSTLSCVKKNGKMRVMLNNKNDANLLVLDGFLKDFHLSIPAEHVEIEGAVDWFELCDLDDEQELITAGVGCFNNTALQQCKIVHAERLSKREKEIVTWTNTVKIVFEGQVLPNFVEIYGLRVRVRPFHQKPMFCDRCQQFGHTSRDCRRKQKCASCGAEHATAMCKNIQRSSCSFCQAETQHSRNDCPYFVEVTECYQLKLANRRKARYQQAVAAVSQDSSQETTSNQHILINDAYQFPALHNRFEGLESEENGPDTILKTSGPLPNTSVIINQRPNNPYAKIVREAVLKNSQESPAPKRRRTVPVSSVRQTPKVVLVKSTAQPSVSTPRDDATQSPNHPDTSSSVKLVASLVMAFVRKLGVSQIWISVIEAVIDPLLQALMPQLPDLISALSPAVLIRRNG